MQRSLLGFFSAHASAETSVKNVEKEKEIGESEIDMSDNLASRKIKKTNNTHEHWFALFLWLETNENKSLMFCKTCRDASYKNKFATTGAGKVISV